MFSYRIYVLVFLTLLLVSQSLKAQYHTPFFYDTYRSGHFGANLLAGVHKTLYRLEDTLVPNRLGPETTLGGKALGMAYRMGKLFAFGLPQDYFISLVQHEALGHGSRFREFGFRNNRFEFSFPFPYGNGLGRAIYGKPDENVAFTLHKQITVAFSGNEANTLLSNRLTAEILLTDQLHYRQAMLYLFTNTTPLAYIWLTKWSDPSNPFAGEGNDVLQYLKHLNWMYNVGGNEKATLNKLARNSLISLINPLPIYAFYALLVEYGFKGKSGMRTVPVFKLGNLKYLPVFSSNLTPFGDEYAIKNYLMINKRLWTIDLSVGDGTYNRFWAGGVNVQHLVQSIPFVLNLSGSFWSQPDMNLDDFSDVIRPNQLGGALKAEAHWRPFAAMKQIRLYLQAGYKTKGYLMGEPLDKSIIFRPGFSCYF